MLYAFKYASSVIRYIVCACIMAFLRVKHNSDRHTHPNYITPPCHLIFWNNANPDQSPHDAIKQRPINLNMSSTSAFHNLHIQVTNYYRPGILKIEHLANSANPDHIRSVIRVYNVCITAPDGRIHGYTKV